jgi:hypothetical protein
MQNRPKPGRKNIAISFIKFSILNSIKNSDLLLLHAKLKESRFDPKYEKLLIIDDAKQIFIPKR